jgi:AraC family transcriptional regulator, transcriptional activator of pobA
MTTLPFVAGPALRIEVQRFDGAHFNVTAGPHAHAFHEILVLDEGRGEHVIGGDRVALRAGDAVTIAPGGAHDCAGTAGLEGWLVLFCADAVSERADGGASLSDPRWSAFAGPMPEARLQLRGGDRRAVERAVDELRQATASPDVGGITARLRAAATLDLLLLDLGEQVRARGTAPAGPVDPVVALVLAEIDRDFARQLSLAVLARRVGLSGSHLTGRVRQATGRTVQQWIIDRRLAEARRLLRETDLTVMDVADRAGYVDVTHFRRQFRRAHGTPPGAWRRQDRRPAADLPPPPGDPL